MLNEAITLISASEASHTITGTVTAPMRSSVTVNDSCVDGDSVQYQDMFDLRMAKAILPGTSGGLVIDGDGNILGMHLLIQLDEDESPTRVGVAGKAAHIQEVLNFDTWVGSETLPLRGGFQIVKNDADPPVPQQLTGWAIDPLNPRAALPIEIYVNGPKGTGTRVGTLTANVARTDVNVRGYSGNHGFTWTIPTAHRTSTAWYVYALDQATDTTADLAVRRRLLELKLPTDWTGVSSAGVGFLKNYESFVGYPYDDADVSSPKTRVTAWSEDRRITIGYGHLIDSDTEWKVLPRDANGAININETKATDILTKDLTVHIANVRARVGIPISQAEFDALTFLSFNIGEGKVTNHDKGFAGSSVARYLDNDSEGAAPDTAYASVEEAWQAFHKADGQKSNGLVKRRRDEWRMFCCESYTRTP